MCVPSSDVIMPTVISIQEAGGGKWNPWKEYVCVCVGWKGMKKGTHFHKENGMGVKDRKMLHRGGEKREKNNIGKKMDS